MRGKGGRRRGGRTAAEHAAPFGGARLARVRARARGRVRARARGKGRGRARVRARARARVRAWVRARARVRARVSAKDGENSEDRVDRAESTQVGGSGESPPRGRRSRSSHGKDSQ